MEQVLETPVAAETAVATVRERTSLGSQALTLVAVVVPPLGLFAAMGLLWDSGFRLVDLVLLLVLYVLCGQGITVGFHRYFTHRGFEARLPVKVALAVLGCMAMQGPLTQWVTDHRKHHALSDKEGDPHSPHAGHDDGFVGSVKGLVHAHVGWMFTLKGLERGRVYGRDLYEDRLIRMIDRLYVVWVVLTFGIPFAIGYAFGGTVGAGVEALVWGGLLRVFLYQHATFSVNSICHMFGRRAYRSRDESRNNWLVAALTFGEGWHNNHHAFPSSARHGLDRLQLDLSWWTIRALERARLVRDVRLPTPVQRERRRLAPSA